MPYVPRLQSFYRTHKPADEEELKRKKISAQAVQRIEPKQRVQLEEQVLQRPELTSK